MKNFVAAKRSSTGRLWRSEALRQSRRRALVDDDDSDTEQRHVPEQALHALRAKRAEDAPSFSIDGVDIWVDMLGHCRVRNVQISSAVAMLMTGGVCPEGRTLLHHGCLASSAGYNASRSGQVPRAFSLQLLRGNNSCGRRVLISEGLFFNFPLRQWQPLSRLSAYMPTGRVLYCAFRPVILLGPRSSATLFVKIGYRSLGAQEESTLVGYVEKKSKELRLTNVAGAGIFVLPVPRSHSGFEDPARAAEESLKSAVRDSEELRVVPTGHRGDVGIFSASLEYLCVDSRRPDATPLQALTEVLRKFGGEPSLEPYRVAASGGGRHRCGRKRLAPWCAASDGDFELAGGGAVAQGAVTRPPLASTVALRSRYAAKVWRPSARRKRARCASLQPAKKVRKAGSVP